jgi:acetyltransferase-like isoleucine patch superfamily enzyme
MPAMSSPILSQTPHDAIIRLDAALIELLDTRRIFCSHQYRDSPRRWKPGQVVTVGKNALLEPYVGLLGGNRLYTVGAYSYSHSELTTSISIGRYCSIAEGVTVSGW